MADKSENDAAEPGKLSASRKSFRRVRKKPRKDPSSQKKKHSILEKSVANTKTASDSANKSWNRGPTNWIYWKQSSQRKTQKLVGPMA